MIKKIYLLKIYIRERTGLKYLNDSKAFLNIQMIWMIFVKTLKVIIQIKNEKYWSCLEVWLLICLVNKKLYPIVTELFIRGWRLNLFLVFIIQSYSAVPKNIRLNSTHYFIMKNPNKQERENFLSNNSSDIDIKDSMYLYKNVLQKHIPFQSLMLLLHQIILLRFRKNLLERI